MTEREQKLVDICFACAMMVREYSDRFKDSEAVARYVAEQLKGCGFPTYPVGMSWGVLDE